MERKNKYQRKALDFVQRLQDVRFAGQVLFVLIVLLTSWSGVKTIQTNYGLQKQITALKQQNSLQELQNTNLALQNQYYNSQQYLELSARQNFGLAAKGEQEMVVPRSVALAYTRDVSVPGTEVAKSQTKQPVYVRNFEAWKNFFLHHQST